MGKKLASFFKPLARWVVISTNEQELVTKNYSHEIH